jgi:hypothetical protein
MSQTTGDRNDMMSTSPDANSSHPLPAPQRCLNCGHSVTGPYCAQCGQRFREERLALIPLASEAARSVGLLERGVLRTAVELFSRPGGMIVDYIHGKRCVYTAPITMLLFATTFSVIAAKFLAADLLDAIMNDSLQGYDEMPGMTESRLTHLKAVYRGFIDATALSYILCVIPSVFIFRLIHWRGPYNLAEITVFVLYTCTHWIALDALFYALPIPFTTGSRMLTAFLVGLLAVGWQSYECFGRRWWPVVIHPLIVMCTFLVTSTVVATLFLIYVYLFVD